MSSRRPRLCHCLAQTALNLWVQLFRRVPPSFHYDESLTNLWLTRCDSRQYASPSYHAAINLCCQLWRAAGFVSGCSVAVVAVAAAAAVALTQQVRMVHPRVQRRPLSPNWICQFDWSVNRVAVVVLDWADEVDNRLTRPNSICFQWMMEAIESAVASDGLFWHRSVTRCRHPASFLVILPNFSLIIARYSILKRLAGGPITGIGSSWTEFDRIRSNRIGPERRGKSEKSVQIRKWRNYRPGRSTAPEFHPTMQSSMEPLCGKLPAPLNSLTCNRMAISTHRIQSLGKQTITSIRCFLARKRRLWSALSTATRVHVRFKCPVEFHSIGVQWPRPLIDPTTLPPPSTPSHPIPPPSL